VKIKRAKYLSFRHIIMIVCEIDIQAGEVWRIMPDSRDTEVQDSVLNHKFLVLAIQFNLSSLCLALLCS